ncbi:MAG: SusC/RagA family TonB-linked outer membrane protein [Bacteroidia bacterium]|nr:SusC/RagA family TonB-linked outer membrane protein [Bacteroidia bacterium]NND25978.1 SusC/RagA family TonB-linked outer membrane protein [Flavobacteriaceae bacterium]MBT8277671.1 SusC/RagA family TonB-linked outer membrane protein [Bacteroidia bacterium]NNK59191.1 SusC/RagA family TonB-linked outer membrane protein [Flavobacteriaceae bacterium]NNL32363.1 SusC/RagA family TonB-linked outer membrane protein [Flavobacteriaceae bacterium]
MKTKFSGILTLLLAFVVQFTFAQGKTISGTVTDAMGALPGVNIIVKGTSTGTQTDFDGKYSITANAGDVLVFSFVGYVSQEQTVGSANTINVTLEEDVAVLEEVVVTAQGIKREKKALGYAVSEVSSDDIEQRTEGDVARVLSGKASGVQITSQSGTSGSATNVVIRGYNSINGSNQALFVVDGVPFSSDTNAQGNFLNGNVGSSRFLDLDPNNIESVNVLKGLAAATLYGTAGRNGVIVITTKSGAAGSAGPKKTEITVSQSYFVNEMASLPDYQNQYGGGFDQSFGWFFSNWGPAFAADGVDGYLNDPAGAIDANGTVLHPYASSAFLNPNGPSTGTSILAQQFAGQRYDWRPYDSVGEFFRSGGVSNSSINIRGASNDGNISYNVNYGHLDEKGFTPGNKIVRNTLSVGGRAKLSNKFTINASLNFSRNDVVSPPVAASRGNGTLGWSTFGNVFFTPRNVDLMGLPFEIPENGGSIYYRNGNDIINPRWSVKNAQNGQLTNRVFGTASLTYDFNDNLNLTYRAGVDFYNERNQAHSNKNGVNFNNAIFGFLNTWDNNVRIWDHYVSLGGNYDLTSDQKLGLTFTAGATSRSRVFDQQGVASTGQIVFGVLRHFNFQNQLPIQGLTERNIVGVFGEASFDWDNFAFLTVSARNDWVSNLPTENNNKFYPSISASFLPTAAFDGLKSDNGLNYLKIRAGIGQSAGFPTGYPSVNTVNQSTQVNGGLVGGSGGIVTNSVSNFQANPDLKPELISEFEVGFDARAWNNRINVSVSYFDRTTEDLIVFKPLAPSTGFTQTQENIGKVEGDGWEVDLGVDIFDNDGDGFNWNSRLNFTKSEQIVTEQDDDQILFAGSTNPVLGANAAIEGEQLGVLVGTRIARDADGNFLVNASGSYVSESNIVLPDGRSITPIIGNPNPDYVMNFINSLSYKNFNLGFQISHTKGGDISSATVATLLGRGLIVTDRKNTFILPGVQQSTGLPNETQINNSQFYFSNVLFGPKELTVYDGSVVRLQEISLGYSFSEKFLDKTPFGTLSITASGFNLWYDAYNTPDRANFDPNVAGVGVGNGRGFDYLNGPSSKRYGLSIKASF